ncbi:MAG: helical backbone metal receptor [Candidatus Nanopelagicales bacterium]|nr:helical backbone metal receptor [Candidatus Nanopelagicales bacterium]
MHDDLGVEVRLSGPPVRVVSLVPSITEAIAITCPQVLVGATDWCTHPARLEVVRVRGPKNPDLGLILGLRPDLVVANVEENRRVDVDRLRAAGIAVWVTRIDSVAEALASLGRLLGVGLGLGAEPRWLTDAGRVWAGAMPPATLRVAVPVWRDPWIWVGGRTYASDVLARLGWANVLDAVDRYPHRTVEAVLAEGPDLVLVPDEPYPFRSVPDLLAGVRTALVPGRSLFWYGPAMIDGRRHLIEAAGG